MAIGLGSLIAFLEEGQNDDWFTSVFIQRCFALAVIFIPLFIICELVSKTPVVNLRLLRIRNLGLASAVNFLLGASLYGSVFLLPEYLEQVQNYSARQTGQVTEFQRCVFKTAANRAAPVREAVISVPTRSRSRTR